MFYTVTPLPDELLSSWFIRCSIFNGTDPIGFTESIWYNERVWTKDIDRFFPQEKINYIQRNTSLSVSQIYDMTLEPIYTELIKPKTINPKKYWQYIIPTGIRNRTKTNGLHFCSLCLKEPIPYMRKQWRLSWNCICEKHHILLQLRCYKCNKCFSPHLISYTDTDFTKCQYCKTSLVDTTCIPIKESVLELQKHLNNSLQKKTIADNRYPIIANEVSELFTTVRGFMLFFRDLVHTKNYHLYRDYLFKELSYQYTPIDRDNASQQSSIDALPVAQRYQLLDMVSHIFQFHITEIIAMLIRTDISKQLFTRSITLHSPTLIHISKSLKNRSKIIKKKVIQSLSTHQPSTKDEVESLMEAIRQYL